MPSIREERLASPGFTLVEMLLVILVIAVLAGMILFSAKKIGQSNAKAVSVERIEKLRAAVEEFYAEYGQYPPVPYYAGRGQPVYFELPSADTIAKAGALQGNSDWGAGPIFTFGLLAYLQTRWAPFTNVVSSCGNQGGSLASGNSQWDVNNAAHADQDRDVAAMKRWAPFLNGIVAPGQPIPENYGGMVYTNQMNTVYDGWGRNLQYHSAPPYQSYDIWSVGADGQDGGWLGCALTNDAQRRAAADDIHSGAGH